MPTYIEQSKAGHEPFPEERPSSIVLVIQSQILGVIDVNGHTTDRHISGGVNKESRNPLSLAWMGSPPEGAMGEEDLGIHSRDMSWEPGHREKAPNKTKNSRDD